MSGSKFTHDTDDWKLDCFIDWSPKYHREDCKCCGGSGEIGGGLGWLGDKEVCPECHGLGYINEGPKTKKPELPKALVEHLRRAWWDYFNKE